MKAWQTRILGLLIIAGGIALALPFRRAAGPAAPIRPRDASQDVVWRSSDFTLEVVASADHSPAAALHEGHERSAPSDTPWEAGARVTGAVTLESATPPPDLAPRYQVADHADAAVLLPPRHDQPPAEPPHQPPAERKTRVIQHRLVDGDTLEQLAEEYLGSRLRWTEIYNANPDVLDNPEVLPLGAVIMITPDGGGGGSNNGGGETAGDLVPVGRKELQRLGSPTTP